MEKTTDPQFVPGHVAGCRCSTCEVLRSAPHGPERPVPAVERSGWSDPIVRKLTYVGVGLATLIVGAAAMGPKVWALVALAAMIGAYFFPTIVASIRRHHNANSVFVINLFLGWTVIGWVVALAMAVSAVRSERR